MDDTQLFDFDSPTNQSSYIKVIGVGGGGNNAVNHMFRKGITGVDFIVTNTDKKALESSPVPNKLPLGNEGLGVGGNPAKARRAAEEKEKEIKDIFSHNTKMVFITAGMGGGTGTGAAPVIARFAKDIKLQSEYDDEPSEILVVAVVTTPFLFEGRRRIDQAMEGVKALEDIVDSILVINNEKLRYFGNLGLTQAFSVANDVLLTAVKGIAEIITLNAYVNIDFRDVNTVMAKSGTALMGIGEGQGENRAMQAVEEAAKCPLLNDDDIAKAKNVLLYLACGPDTEITMDEMGAVTDYITQRTGSLDTNVIWGSGFDETLGEKVKVTLIATGFDHSEKAEPQIHSLEPDTPKEPPVQPTPQDGPEIIRKPEPQAPSQPEPSPKSEETPARPGQRWVLEDTAPTPKPQQAAPAPKDINDFVVRPAHVAQQPQSQPAVTPSQPVTEVRTAPAPAPAVAHVEPVAPRTEVKPERPVTDMPLSSVTTDRAARIRHIHELLRNNENGPAMVEDMDPAQLMGVDIYQASESAESETKCVLNANGDLVSVPSLFSLPD